MLLFSISDVIESKLCLILHINKGGMGFHPFPPQYFVFHPSNPTQEDKWISSPFPPINLLNPDKERNQGLSPLSLLNLS